MSVNAGIIYGYLKKRVKKLEKRKRSRTQGLKLFKMGTSKRRSLDKEDATKHGRNLNARLISKEDDFDDGFDVVRDEGITHVEGDAEQVVICNTSKNESQRKYHIICQLYSALPVSDQDTQCDSTWYISVGSLRDTSESYSPG
ncbi:hypothetical protein Tco_0819557 [Tanacetum coccineum]|uniref:Uncharacterized protein n=1 Tax=Tanacetum coccineum TaxID=301880 RepID=A0ABQ5A7W9_9ASTR